MESRIKLGTLEGFKDLRVLLDVFICIAIADFLSGFFHWLEDNYGSENWLIIGDFITKPNIQHHQNPRSCINCSWLLRSRVLLGMGTITLGTFYLCNCLNWQTMFIILLGINTNEIHRWAHQTKSENGKIITFLHKLGIIQSPAHHALHHKGKKQTYYCVITNFLNPILDTFGLWSFLEFEIARILGLQRRLDYP